MDPQGLVLVTGATGFVGKWTVIELLKRGYAVRGTIRDNSRAAQVRQSVAEQTGAAAAELLDLRYRAGMTLESIGDRLGQSPGAVHRRINRILASMRRRAGEEPDD